MSDYAETADIGETRRISAVVRKSATGRKLHVRLDQAAVDQLSATHQLQLVIGDVDFEDAGPGTIQELEELTINVF